MIRIKGLYNEAICYTDELEPTARAQILAVCDRPEFADSKIRIMPDVHAGMGCTIGTTMTVHDKIVPGMVGVDIGCGMETTRIEERSLDFAQLDRLIRREIPSGMDVRTTLHPLNDEIDLTELRCAQHVGLPRAQKSIGTLGGGNHFIEVDRDDDGALYLVVHSGSRNIGKQVADYYQKMAIRQRKEAKDSGGEKPLPRDLMYVTDELFDDYLYDMKLIQRYAVLNRRAMTDTLIEGMGVTVADRFTTIHNYINVEEKMLRKGAISAHAGERVLIPMNMRDGSLICIGKGNPDWNCSAPHGAGRIMSRKQASATLSLEQYRDEMRDVYTTSVSRKTLDEAPMAYKPMEEILAAIGGTADVVKQIVPVYNFKAADR